MKVCLTTKFEIDKQSEIANLLNIFFSGYNIKVIIEPRGSKKKIKKIKEEKKEFKKSKTPKKVMSAKEREWRDDYEYNLTLQEREMQKLIDYYKKVGLYTEIR